MRERECVCVCVRERENKLLATFRSHTPTVPVLFCAICAVQKMVCFMKSGFLQALVQMDSEASGLWHALLCVCMCVCVCVVSPCSLYLSICLCVCIPLSLSLCVSVSLSVSCLLFFCSTFVHFRAVCGRLCGNSCAGPPPPQQPGHLRRLLPSCRRVFKAQRSHSPGR